MRRGLIGSGCLAVALLAIMSATVCPVAAQQTIDLAAASRVDFEYLKPTKDYLLPVYRAMMRRRVLEELPALRAGRIVSQPYNT